jgi:hypothetical protein
MLTKVILAMAAVAHASSMTLEEKFDALTTKVETNSDLLAELLSLSQAPKASCYGRRQAKPEPAPQTTNPTPTPQTASPTTQPTNPPKECEGMTLWPHTTQDKYLELQSCTSIKSLEIRGGPGGVVELNSLKKVDGNFHIQNSGTELTSVKALNLEFIGGNFHMHNNFALPQDGVQLPALKSIGSNGGGSHMYFANNFVNDVQVSFCATNPAGWKDTCSATAGCAVHICQ